MSNWADEALKRMNDEQINKHTKNDLFLEKRRVRKEYGMPLWLEVRELVKAKCEEFNTKARKPILVFRVGINTELSVRADLDGGTKMLNAEFDEAVGKLSWSCGSSRGNWTIEPTDDGKAEFSGSHGPSNMEQIADEMLSALI